MASTIGYVNLQARRPENSDLKGPRSFREEQRPSTSGELKLICRSLVGVESVQVESEAFPMAKHSLSHVRSNLVLHISKLELAQTQDYWSPWLVEIVSFEDVSLEAEEAMHSAESSGDAKYRLELGIFITSTHEEAAYQIEHRIGS